MKRRAVVCLIAACVALVATPAEASNPLVNRFAADDDGVELHRGQVSGVRSVHPSPDCAKRKSGAHEHKPRQDFDGEANGSRARRCAAPREWVRVLTPDT